jgi:thioredoxin-like negative regulator of GroEL
MHTIAPVCPNATTTSNITIAFLYEFCVFQVTADWCRACKFIEPKFDKLAAEFTADVLCVRILADADPQVLADIGAKSLPAFALFHRGSQLDLQYIKETSRLAELMQRASALSQSCHSM